MPIIGLSQVCFTFTITHIRLTQRLQIIQKSAAHCIKEVCYYDLSFIYPNFMFVDRASLYKLVNKSNSVHNSVYNTLRTGDADLRFYIKTVQDG